ncbi:MAG TPA: response regulator [Gemmatimonadales bacterium]|nr:response regulator [Gemmatimonadales bacterium]
MGNLALIVEPEAGARGPFRRRLEDHGYDPVETSTVISALELVQRLASSFRLVLTRLELPGLPGVVLVEVLRLLHPDIPVLCLAGEESSAVALGCPRVSEGGAELGPELRRLDESRSAWRESSSLSADVRQRACERYRRTGDLVEAAYEVARGMVA